jgi:hypothetical protein
LEWSALLTGLILVYGTDEQNEPRGRSDKGEEMPVVSASSALNVEPVFKKSLRLLPDYQAHTVAILDAYLGSGPRLDGPSYHRFVGQWVSSDRHTVEELREWLKEALAPEPLSTAKFDRALRRAELFDRASFQVAAWKDEKPPMDEAIYCPQILFGIGIPRWDVHRASVFNSRKPRLVSPHEEWLSALRAALPRLSLENMGFSSSLGTLTYDLVAEYAHSVESSLLLVLSSPVEDIVAAKASPLLGHGYTDSFILTCRTKAACCPKSTAQLCRDRMLAFLTDLHVILEIRPGGNLIATLLRQQLASPRFQRIYISGRRETADLGSYELFERFPGRSKAFSLEADSGIGKAKENLGPPIPGLAHHRPWLPELWSDYLYHYTRSCPGPWPGQAYRAYLSSLLKNDPISGHTALDTLIRIVSEGRIRASSKLIRGSHKAISFTALPPPKLADLRKWNSALTRWTVEPYGVAVSRRLLKAHGASPTIYAKEAVYSRIKASYRFRFQRHELPGRSWKHEREWRLPGDFDFGSAVQGELFLFVDTHEDARRLQNLTEYLLPVVIVGDLQGSS